MYYYNNLTTGASQWDYPVTDQQQLQQQQPTIASVSHATSATAAAFQAAQVMVMQQPHLMPMMNIAAAASVYPHAPMMMAAPAIATSLTTAVASLVSPSLGFSSSRDQLHTDAKKRSGKTMKIFNNFGLTIRVKHYSI